MSLQTIVSLTLMAMLVCWSVGAYNRLVRLKNASAQVYAQIDLELTRRHDLIPRLLETARPYLPHEQGTLESVSAAGKQASAASDALRSKPGKPDALLALAAAEQTLDSSLDRFFAFSETISDLKADPALHELGEELARTKTKFGFARQAYNAAVLAYNKAQDQFPALLIARLFGFTPSTFLTEGALGHQPAGLSI